MTTIAAILAAEIAAFQNLQITSGAYAGAMAEKWVADNSGTQFFTGQKYDSYAACRSMCFAMQGYIQTGQAVPSWLMTMAGNYIDWAFKKMAWSQEITTAAGTDSSTYSYRAGDYLLHLRDGTTFALRSNFNTSPMTFAGRTSTNYTTSGYAQAAKNLQSMFVKGAVYNHYCLGNNVVWPGFAVNRADYSFTDPIDKMIRRAYEKGYVTATQGSGGAASNVVTVTSVPSYGSTVVIAIGSKFTWPNGDWCVVSNLGTGSGGVGTYIVDCSQSEASNDKVFVESYAEQQYVAIDADVYDGNDALCGTLIELVRCYFDQKGASYLASWVTSTVNSTTNWEALRCAAASGLSNCDPDTGLPFATPFTRASFFQDTVETLQGVQALCEICETLVAYDPQTFSAYSAGGFSLPATRDWAAKACASIRHSLVQYTQSQLPQPGLINDGWNGEVDAPLNATPTDHQSVLQPWATGFMAGYFYGVPGNSESESAIDATYLGYMTTLNGGAGFPTASPWTPTAIFPDLYGAQLGVTQPCAYYYLKAAMAIGSPGAPFTRAQFEAFVNAVYTANTTPTPNRPGTLWWSFESGAFIWLCNILISKGSI